MKDEHSQVVSTASTDIIRSKEKTAAEGERATYMLLADHPHFIEGVAKVRRRMGIPRDGFTDRQRAYEWEHADHFNKKELWDAVEKLLADFKIKPAFRSDVKFFACDYVLAPKTVENLLPLPSDLSDFEEETIRQTSRRKIGARVIQTDTDRERYKYQFKSNALYLEITDQTNTRNISAALTAARKRRKDLKPYTVPKPEAIARRVWLLTMNEMPDKEIAERISVEFDRSFPYNDVPVYRKRYKDALQELRPLEE